MENAEAQAQLCRWFAGLLARELSRPQLVALQRGEGRALIDVLQIFMDDRVEVRALSNALAALGIEASTETRLATDHAALFLMPGAGSAPPFASCYTEPGLLFGRPHHEMQRRLEQGGLAVDGAERMPADHIAIMLDYLAYCFQRHPGVEDPDLFVASALAPWMPRFAHKVSVSAAGHSLYAPAVNAMCAFLIPDWNCPVSA